MITFKPQFTIKATGQVIAEFSNISTASQVAQVFEWVRKEQWKGCLQIHFPGNGGVQGVKFAESPKPLKSE